MTGVNSLVKFVMPGLLGLTAGFVVLPAVFGDQDQNGVRRFLRTRPMIYVGGISYGIYLWHFIFVVQSVHWVANGTLPDVLFVRFIAVVTLTIAMASASFYIVERPLISWSQRKSRKTSAGASHHRVNACSSRRRCGVAAPGGAHD